MSEFDTSNDNNQNLQRFLLVRVKDDHYGLSLKHVVEAVVMQDFTVVPCSKPHFLGIIDLRGRVVPLIDISIALGLEKEYQPDVDGEQGIVICAIGESLYGIVVSAIETVFSLNPNEVQKRPPIRLEQRSDFILGVTKRDERLTLLFDINAFLQQEDISTIKQIESNKAA